LLALSSATWYSAPLETHSNPLVTPNHTVAPWYFYWLQGLLKIPHIIPFLPTDIATVIDRFFANVLGLTPKVLWGIVIGPLVFVLLLVVPYIDPNPSRRYGQRKIMLALGGVFAAVILYLSLAGIPTGVPFTGFGYVGGSPASEIAQHFMPDEGEGHLMTIPYDDMLPGEYTVSGDPATGAAGLDKVIKEVYYDMVHRMENADPYGQKLSADATVKVVIAEIQPDLRQISVVIDYTDENGSPQQYNKFKFIHRESER
jgi:hypothetical protein